MEELQYRKQVLKTIFICSPIMGLVLIVVALSALQVIPLILVPIGVCVDVVVFLIMTFSVRSMMKKHQLQTH